MQLSYCTHFRLSDIISNCTSDSGSGSGLPFLIQQTIARQTTLLECVGKGRFGEVWHATCQGEDVAVKIFSSRDGASWARETEIYNMGLLRHPNLLTYYASDIISRGGCTQMWLITAFLAAGSLYDYLQTKTISLIQGLAFARSAAAGVVFLHSELSSFHMKPAIAHRDIKSKNILILSNGEACLADLGLALVRTNRVYGPATALYGNYYSHIESSLNSATSPSARPPTASPLAGTKRYMSPELLTLFYLLTRNLQTNCQIENESEDVVCLSELTECHHPLLPFEVYQASDIYALSLVFWEIANRIEMGNCDHKQAEEYQLPYYDCVPANPTFIDMFRVVVLGKEVDYYEETPDEISIPMIPLRTCNACQSIEDRLLDASRNSNWMNKPAGRRPSLNSNWQTVDSRLQRFSMLISECWNPIWKNRLSALRIRKTLEKLELEIHI